ISPIGHIALRRAPKPLSHTNMTCEWDEAGGRWTLSQSPPLRLSSACATYTISGDLPRSSLLHSNYFGIVQIPVYNISDGFSESPGRCPAKLGKLGPVQRIPRVVTRARVVEIHHAIVQSLAHLVSDHLSNFEVGSLWTDDVEAVRLIRHIRVVP